MLNKMSLLLATAAIALSVGAGSAATLNFANDNNHRHGGPSLSVDFSTVAFGYNDGYWDNGHQWHAWRNNAERTRDRAHSGTNSNG